MSKLLTFIILIIHFIFMLIWFGYVNAFSLSFHTIYEVSQFITFLYVIWFIDFSKFQWIIIYFIVNKILKNKTPELFVILMLLYSIFFLSTKGPISAYCMFRLCRWRNLSLPIVPSLSTKKPISSYRFISVDEEAYLFLSFHLCR